MIKKIVNILLIVVIPLLCAFGVGVYGYNRYTSTFMVKSEEKGYYDTRIEEKNTESEIKAYLDFYTTYYKEILNEEVKNSDNVKLFTIKGYSTFYLTYDEDGNEESRSLNYLFFAYDINYGMLYKEIYKNNSSRNIGSYIPQISVNFIDHDKIDTDEELEYGATVMSPISIVELVDYNWVGYTDENGNQTKKNSEGNRLSFNDTVGSNSSIANVKVAGFEANKEYSSNLDLEFTVTDVQYSSYDESTVTIGTISLQNIVQKAKNFDTEDEALIKGYAEDIYEAGYFKYAFSRYIWWEALIALVLTLIVTGATVIVWNYSDDSKKKTIK